LWELVPDMTQSRSPVHPSPQPARQPARPPTRPPASTQSHRFLTPAGRGTAPTRRELPGGQALGFLCVCGDERAWDLLPRAKKVFASSKTRRDAGEKADDRRGDCFAAQQQQQHSAVGACRRLRVGRERGSVQERNRSSCTRRVSSADWGLRQ
jgi:hypothetical protein